MILNEQNPWLMDDQIICRMATTVMMRGAVGKEVRVGWREQRWRIVIPVWCRTSEPSGPGWTTAGLQCHSHHGRVCASASSRCKWGLSAPPPGYNVTPHAGQKVPSGLYVRMP